MKLYMQVYLHLYKCLQYLTHIDIPDHIRSWLPNMVLH